MDSHDAMKIYMRTYSDMMSAMNSVYLHKVLYDHGLLHLYYDWPIPPVYAEEIDDFGPGIAYEALISLSEFVWEYYSKDSEVHTIYFSHPAIMEYYRLCRIYSRQRGIPLCDNPYMKQAADYVRNHLDQGQYTCEYRLQTRINHRWASGIVFRMWPEFNEHLVLLVIIAKIYAFYERELVQLKAETQKIESPDIGQEAA